MTLFYGSQTPQNAPEDTRQHQRTAYSCNTRSLSKTGTNTFYLLPAAHRSHVAARKSRNQGSTRYIIGEHIATAVRPPACRIPSPRASTLMHDHGESYGRAVELQARETKLNGTEEKLTLVVKISPDIILKEHVISRPRDVNQLKWHVCIRSPTRKAGIQRDGAVMNGVRLAVHSCH